MIRTSSVNGSEEMKNTGLAMAIEMIVATGSDGGKRRQYYFEFEGVRDPEDEGSVQVENLFSASWPVEDGEPRWKRIIRRIFKIPTT